MELTNFYYLSDQVKQELNSRGLLSGTEYDKFLSAAAKVGDKLVNSSGASPYSESTFWPSVEAVVTGWGKNATNDMDARETALIGILYPLTAPPDLIDQVLLQPSALIASQEATSTTLTSTIQSLQGTPKYLILSANASGITSNEQAVIKLLTSADSQNFVTKTIGTITSDGTFEYFIDCLTIPKHFKVQAAVTGTLTISVIGTLKS